jgi:sodium-independent sulfate anion transporter 11
VLDFSTVNAIDITSLQGLIDLRGTLDRWAAPVLVEWHFAGVHNSWTRRALAFAGFGLPAIDNVDELGTWCPAYTVATSLAGATEEDERELHVLGRALRAGNGEGVTFEERKGSKNSTRVTSRATSNERPTYVPIYGVDRPFFHIDLQDAVDAAVRDAKKLDSKSYATAGMACTSVDSSERASPV